MKSLIGRFAGFLLIVAVGWPAPSTPQGAAGPAASAEDTADFPDLPGRDETFGFCTGCHNFKLVAAQGMNREAWNETLNYMTNRHGMADIQGEDRDAILDYLAKAFPQQRANQPGGWQNPFAN